MFREGIQLRNGVLTVQYSILGENLVAVILLPDTNYLPKDPFIVCGCTIECRDGNADLISFMRSFIEAVMVVESGLCIASSGCALVVERCVSPWI